MLLPTLKRPLDEPVPWWSKRGKADALSSVQDEGALLKLLEQKGRRNSELRAEVEQREEQLVGAKEELRVAHMQIEALSRRVQDLEAEVGERENEAAARRRGVAVFAARIASRGDGSKRAPGKRGKARRGAERAGRPTCETQDLPLANVPTLQRMGIKNPYDLQLAIMKLKSPNVKEASPELRTVSGYQARQAIAALRLCGGPWKRGCVASFLAYMESREYEDTGARDRRHWLCMKLWPGRFATPKEYRQHEACMSKAGKFITSISKLRAVYERDLARQEEQKKKDAAL